MSYSIQALSRDLDLHSFDSGIAPLNEYLKKYARQNHDRGISKAFVAIEKGHKKVLGFYTVSAGQIEVDGIPQTHSKHLPRYPIPALRIGRLAVDKGHQGRGLGGQLLWDALQRAYSSSKQIGVFAVVVDAKDAKAAAFYAKYGFISLTHSSLKLFLPIQVIQNLF